MATGYVRGRRFEYEVKKKMEDDGYFCVRSAGSRGLVDLLCVKKGSRPVMVQCKRSTKCSGSALLTAFEKLTLKDLAVRHGCSAMLAWEKNGEVNCKFL